MSKYPYQPTVEESQKLLESHEQLNKETICRQTEQSSFDCREQQYNSIGETVDMSDATVPTVYPKVRIYTKSKTSTEGSSIKYTSDTETAPGISSGEDEDRQWAVFEACVPGGGAPVFTTKPGAEAFVHAFMLDLYKYSTVMSCFCKEYDIPEFKKKKKKKPKGSKTISKPQSLGGSEEETAFSKPGDPSVSEDTLATRETQLMAEGQNISKVYGEAVIGGALLWVDAPYAVPYIEASPAEFNLTLKHNDVDAISHVEEQPDTLRKKYKYYTNILVSLGQSGITEVENLTIDGVFIDKEKYRLVTNGLTFVHNGDYNASAKMPSYRDLSCVYIENVEVSNFTNIRAHVHSRTVSTHTDHYNVTTDTIVPLTSNIIRFKGQTIKFYDSKKIEAANLMPLHTRSSHSLVFPIAVNAEPQWWDTEGSVLYYYTNNSFYRYDTLSGQPVVDRTLVADPDIINIIRPEMLFVYTVGTTVHWEAYHTELTAAATKIVSFNGGADVFTEDCTVVRVIPNFPGATKFYLRHFTTLHNVMTTTQRYLVQCDERIDIYLRSDLTYVGTVTSVPATAGVSIDSDMVSRQDEVYRYYMDNKVYVIDVFNEVWETEDLTMRQPKTQFFDAETIVAVNTDGSVSVVNTSARAAVTQHMTVGWLLEKLDYPFPAYYTTEITGAVNTGTKALIDTLTNLYALPKGDTSGVIAVDDSNSDIIVDVKTADDGNDYVSLDYNTLSLTNDEPRTVEFNKNANARDAYSLSTTITYSDDEAWLVAANYFSAAKAKLVAIELDTTDLRIDTGTVVQYNNKLFKITSSQVGFRSKLTGYLIPSSDITVVPDYVFPVATAINDEYDEEWQYNGVSLYVIPVSIYDNAKHLYCFRGETPNKVVLNNSNIYSIPVPTSPIGVIGELKEPMIKYDTRNHFTDTTNVFRITFDNDPSSYLSTATEDELRDDKLKNLLIIGHEAVQFTDFTILGDNRTVDFHGSLFRGRFNTGFFVNYHSVDEKCYIFTTEETAAFTYDRNYFTLQADDAEETKKYFHNWHLDYEDGTVNVRSISVEDAGVIKLDVEKITGNVVRVLFSNKPIVFSQHNNLLFTRLLVTGSEEYITVPADVHGNLYWMVVAEGYFPDYGVLPAVGLTEERTFALTAYAVLQHPVAVVTHKNITYTMVKAP